MTLNEQIQDAIKNYSSAASTVSSRYADQPSFETQTRQQIMGGDTALPQLASGFSDKVMELYNYDKTKNATMNMPTTVNGSPTMTTQAGQEMTLNPMIQENAQQSGFRQTLQEKEKAWQLYETRKNVLGDALDKAIKLYETKTKGSEVESDAAYKKVALLQSLYEEENRAGEKAKELSAAGGVLSDITPDDLEMLGIFNSPKTAKERANVENKYDLSKSVASGMTLEEAINRYGAVLDKDEIIKVYDNYSKAGTHTEDNVTVDDWYRRVQKLGSTDPIRGMTTEQQAKWIGYQALLADLNDVKTAIGSGQGTGPLQALRNKTLSAKLGIPSSEAVTMVDSFRAGVIQEKYGSALTETEIKNMGSWVPSGGFQEGPNQQRIDAKYKEKYNAMKALLTAPNVGMSSTAADTYLENLGVIKPGTGSSTGGEWTPTGNTK